MSDLISRQDAIDAVSKALDRQTLLYGFVRKVALDVIKNLPSAQPERKMGKWIPCSERLPEENIPVLLGVKFKDDFKCFVSARIDYNYWTGLGREIRGEMRWMPLPEPYKGEMNEKCG